MKRKTLIWTVTGVGLLAGAAFAMNRYSALAQGPNTQFSGNVPYTQFSGLPAASQPTTTPYGVPPVAGPAPWSNPIAPQFVAYDNRVIAPNGSNTFTAVPVFASPGSHQDEMRVQQLLREYQSSKEEDKRKELVEQISKTVAHQFEEKQSIRERELKELEERVKELRTTHAKRESLKEKIIADRVQQLINNVDGMGWGYEPSNVMVPAGRMLPATSSPLLVPPGQNALPGYMPAETTPGQARYRMLPEPGPSLSTTVAPSSVLPATEGIPQTEPIERLEPSMPDSTPLSKPIDTIEENGR